MTNNRELCPLCQILSLQAEEVQKESQVEEYERELARVRWRLRKLRDEVKQAKRKVQEAGERNTPLQDSIRQSYEEILQVHLYICYLFTYVSILLRFDLFFSVFQRFML